ncbi:Beta-N-acetylglucosaminidase [Nitrospira sp. KM1]|uniref:glycoside hydrolase family 3 protein n=1 Tax=Nitrospira sp. KM1 TaxID=1936990 RepID=UPI0013A73A61|nr:glycoside hydrolase family 3 protein [Nitrospira sp. KM1]BCA53961.1 Beta-N-acetylglucosaminidase [Nitrospira sp. KM1]
MVRIDVGQCFLLGFRGLDIPDWLRTFAASYGLGGVILFDFNCQTRTYQNNIDSPDQVRALCADITALPSRPLVFVDQEGGRVCRLKSARGFAPLPSQQVFNELSDSDKRRLAADSFCELRRLGFHYNLAPVIDLNLNPMNPDIGAIGRSYSNDPDAVRANVRILNDVAHDAGIGLSLKHFPGLGGAIQNSHHDLTDVSCTITDEQLRLFYDLGHSLVGDSVVVSHGIVHQWEADRPVSMSSIAIGKLRQRIPDALLISDDLQMQGLQKKYSTREAVELGLRAGLDLLCIGNNLMPEDEEALTHAQYLTEDALANPILADRVEQGCQRVLRAKARFA